MKFEIDEMSLRGPNDVTVDMIRKDYITRPMVFRVIREEKQTYIYSQKLDEVLKGKKLKCDRKSITLSVKELEFVKRVKKLIEVFDFIVEVDILKQ